MKALTPEPEDLKSQPQLPEYGRFLLGVGFRVIGVAVSLLSAIVTARGLGVTGRGLLYTITSAAQIAAQLLAVGMPSAAVLVVASRPALCRRAVQRALIASGSAGSIILAAAAMIWIGLPGSWFPASAIELSPLIAGLVATQILLAWCSALTQALGAVDRIPVIEVIYRATTVLWAWFALFVLDLTFIAFLGSLVILDLVAAMLWLWDVVRISPISDEQAVWPNEWTRWAQKAYLPLLLNSAVRRVDMLLLSALGGLRAAGLYSIAVQVMDLSQIAPIFLGQKAFFLFSAGKGDQEFLKLLRRILPPGIAATMILAGVAADLWVPWLFGADFLAVGPIILCLVIGSAALGWEIVAVQEINAAGFPIRLSGAWALCFTTMVILMSILIPRLGAAGAGISLSVAYVVLAGLVYRIRHDIRGRAKKPWLGVSP